MLRAIVLRVVFPGLILAAALASFWWLRSMRRAPPRVTQAPRAPAVETVVLEPASATFEIKVHGVVVPRRETTIAAEVAGRIVERSEACRGGRFVKGGMTLVRIDLQYYELQLELANSRVQQIESDLKRIEVEVESNQAQLDIAKREVVLAERELQRNQTLVATDAVAKQQRDESERVLLRIQREVAALEKSQQMLPVQRERTEAELELARLGQQTARLDLDHTIVTAPFDGLIAVEEVEAGEYVQVGDALFTIEESSAVEVECHLRADDLYWLWAGDVSRNSRDTESAYEAPSAKAQVTYRLAGVESVWEGRLSRYEDAGVDQTTRTIPCRVEIENRRQAAGGSGPPALMRGMFVTVVIPVSPGVAMLKVPDRALQPNGHVWAVENEQLRVHIVSTARSLDDGILIRADKTTLESGDRVVVSPLMTAHDGMQVRERAAP